MQTGDALLDAVPGVLTSLPFRPVARGGRVLILGHGFPTGQHVAEVNSYRPDAAPLAVGLCMAANAHREYRAALRLVVAAAAQAEREPSRRAVADLRQAAAACRDVLFKFGG